MATSQSSPFNGHLSPPPDYAAIDHAGVRRNAWQTTDNAAKVTYPDPPPSYQPLNDTLFSVELSGVTPLTPPPALGPLQAGYFPVTPSPDTPPPQYMGYLPGYGQGLTGHHHQVVMIASSQPPVHIYAIESFSGHLALSCFVLWFCNVFFGFIAFILAVKASNSAVSNPYRANHLGRASRAISVTGIAVTLVAVALLISFAATTRRSATDICSRYQYNSKCYNWFCAMCTRQFCLDVKGLYTYEGFCYY